MSATRSFELNKLVRDRIPEMHEAIGGLAIYELLEGKDKLWALHAKLKEELAELEQNQELDINELADVLEILVALNNESGLEDPLEYVQKVEALRKRAEGAGCVNDELEMTRQKKRQQRGGFDLGYFVTVVEVPADSWLADYYASDPERFPEIK